VLVRLLFEWRFAYRVRGDHGEDLVGVAVPVVGADLGGVAAAGERAQELEAGGTNPGRGFAGSDDEGCFGRVEGDGTEPGLVEATAERVGVVVEGDERGGRVSSVGGAERGARRGRARPSRR
jgi:hypothetical protein